MSEEASREFEIAREFEVDARPEEVWEAITTGTGGYLWPMEPPEPKVHPGRDWFYVIEGAVLLRLGGKDHIVRAGQAAEFDTMTPHSMAGFEGPAEIITIFDHHGERTHLRE